MVWLKEPETESGELGLKLAGGANQEKPPLFSEPQFPYRHSGGLSLGSHETWKHFWHWLWSSCGRNWPRWGRDGMPWSETKVRSWAVLQCGRWRPLIQGWDLFGGLSRMTRSRLLAQKKHQWSLEPHRAPLPLCWRKETRGQMRWPQSMCISLCQVLETLAELRWGPWWPADDIPYVIGWGWWYRYGLGDEHHHQYFSETPEKSEGEAGCGAIDRGARIWHQLEPRGGGGSGRMVDQVDMRVVLCHCRAKWQGAGGPS